MGDARGDKPVLDPPPAFLTRFAFAIDIQTTSVTGCMSMPKVSRNFDVMM